jgi:hypothetical protein
MRTQNILSLSLLSLSAFCVFSPAMQAARLNPSLATPPGTGIAPAESHIAQAIGCPRAMPVAYFATNTYQISICQGQDGYFFYRGVEFANPENAINVSEVHLYGYNGQNAFDAVNGDVVYSINPDTLTVWQNGEVIWQESVVSYSYE